VANTYDSINLDSAGGSGSQPTTSVSFLIANWTLNVSEYEITVLASVHTRGVNPQVQVFEKVGTDHVEVVTDIVVQSNGDIIIKIAQTPDVRFDGKIIIIGD